MQKFVAYYHSADRDIDARLVDPLHSIRDYLRRHGELVAEYRQGTCDRSDRGASLSLAVAQARSVGERWSSRTG